MQGGFNTNCRYRGVVFHAQTEDSGIKNPVIVTHLFHQGNVIASCRSNYSDQLGKQDWVEQTRRQMQAQHKAMLRQSVGTKLLLRRSPIKHSQTFYFGLTIDRQKRG